MAASNCCLELFRPILFAPEVQREFGRAPSWAVVRAPQNRALIQSLRLSVDDGEAEAIALASETGFLIIVDDRKARAAARQLGLKIIGTVGCLVRAKRDGLVPALKPALEDLQRAHFHVSEALREEALRLAGE